MDGSMSLSDLPLGQDHPISKKLKWANMLYECLSDGLMSDAVFCSLLSSYREKVEATWQVMREVGVVDECTRCAVLDGGSCCGSGIEDKFDVVVLLINRLLGVELPDRPFDPSGCWFLGERGCLLFARHVICVNFICRRLYDSIDDNGIKAVQRAMEQETEAAFLLEEYIKSKLSELWMKERKECMKTG